MIGTGDNTMKIKTEITERPLGVNEKNDCVVRAIQRRIKTSYERAHEIVSPYRKDGHKCYGTRELIAKLGLELKSFNRSLKQFLEDHPTGCYLVIKRGHAFCVDQGKVYDDGRLVGLNTRIVYYA